MLLKITKFLVCLVEGISCNQAEQDVDNNILLEVVPHVHSLALFLTLVAITLEIIGWRLM